MWHDTAVTRRLGITYPIVQGPFGGGLSSPRLAASVSNAGGLGSFGAQGMTPARITEVIAEIRALTRAPFAVNLWVSTRDDGAEELTREAYEEAVRPLRRFFDELGVEPPAFPLGHGPTFDSQVRALLDAAPPAFSFVFGIPPADVLAECRTRGIVTLGTVTTVEEARAMDAAGVDIIVASGFEAGGHRTSFLRPAESSLTGTFALIPQVVDAVTAPVIAAGGVADGRGVAAALALGASAVQVGTAFLACDESNAIPAHKAALREAHATHRSTVLTRAFTGRLARGFGNSLSEAAASAHAITPPGAKAWLPYPLQGELVSALRAEAIKQDRLDLIALWAGQAAPLVRHQDAATLFAALLADTARVLTASGRA